MKISLNWLKEYVDIIDEPEILAEKLTRAGVAVEYLIYPGKEISGVLTGKVVEITHHPEADKLWICKIDTKLGELEQIVTGAQNVKQDDIVPVARVGSVLPGDKKMKKAKLRGVESFGMLCSASELGIEDKLLQADERSGIYILPKDTPIGVDVKEVLGLNDVVFEFELTANRGDCMSVLGIAREVAAITGVKVKPLDLSLKLEGGNIKDKIDIKIDDSLLCSRFSTRTLVDIKIEPSPMWIQNRLRLSGMRPINNLVDVTNYVMLEIGQPMHAYDAKTLSGNIIMTRNAKAGEELMTLDDIKRTLHENMLVIADAEKAVGLAGVMGGLYTEVSAETKYALLEAAVFNASSVRRTSKSLGLRSEASSRFEHGIDKENTIVALNRAAALLEKIGAAKVCVELEDNLPEKTEQIIIKTDQDEINGILGMSLPVDAMYDILDKLSFKVEKDGEKLIIGVPSWRNDIKNTPDISEEIARIHGYDNIKSTLPQGMMLQGRSGKRDDVISLVKSILVACGLDEMIGYSFTNESEIAKLNLDDSDNLLKTIALVNPITDDFKVMRSTLLTSVLKTAEYNIAHRNEDVAIFEVGSVYLADQLPLKDLPNEEKHLCVLLTGKRKLSDWNQTKENMDFYDAKGIVEELFVKLNLTDYHFEIKPVNYLHPGKSATIVYKEKIVGYLGELHPKVSDNFNVDKKTYIININIEDVVKDACSLMKYKNLAKYPEIYRDLSMIVSEDITHEKIKNAIMKSAGKDLISIRLFDLYVGKQIEKGYKSMAYALSFQAKDRTLTDEEIEKDIAKVIETLEKELDIRLRY